MKNVYRKSILAFFTILMVSGTVPAQSDLGTISGFLRDPSGASIPNGVVTIKNQGGIERQATTNEAGFYTITNIPPGLYTVSVEVPGFQRYESTNNKLDPSGRLAIDATLRVGVTTETIVVEATTAAVQTESATVQKLITREQIDLLELNGRNPVGLASLVPGARATTLANLTFGLSQGPANFNGSRNPENLITFDGAPATRTRSNGASIGAADVDSTQEVQILTANYSPEYGRASGAQIRIISRTGTPQFHGAAYDYLRNNALNANTWSRNANPLTGSAAPLHYNQFGYNIGGPAYIPEKFNTDKSKLFFYWGQEWLKYNFLESGSTIGSNGLLSVPSTKMRQGDFSELLDPNNPFISRTDSGGIKIPVFIRDPQSAVASQCGQVLSSGNYNTNGCFPGNIIPADRRSPNGLGILNAWPVPNLANFIGGNGNWFAAALHTYDQRKDTLSLDANLTARQRLTFRRQNYTYLEYQPLDGNTDRTPKFFDRPNQTNSLNYVWTISPTKVNELLVTASLDVVRIPVDAAHFFDRTKACALPCRLDYPYIFTDGKLIPNRVPTVTMANFSTLSGGPYPSRSSGPIIAVSDSLTWIRGSHTLKFGGLLERAGEDDNDEINVQACPTCTNNQNGQFQFTDGRAGGTGVTAANAALGLFDTYSEIGHRAYTLFRANMWEGFAQDSWSATQKLHVDYGARYTVIVPYHALWGNMIVFDPTFYDPGKAVTIDRTTGLILGTIDKNGLVTGTGSTKDLYNGMIIPGKAFSASAKGRVPEADPNQFDCSRLFRGVPDHYSDIQWGNIQPRLGLAYRLSDKSVIRAGAGRFVTRLGVSDSIFLGGNPPFQPNASVALGSVDNPGGGGPRNIPLVVTSQSRNFENPEAWNWNVTFERESVFKTLLSVAYVGRRGLHLQREANINQPTTAAVAADPTANINFLRPYKGFGSIRETDNVATSRYNALQLNWTRRWTNRLAFGLAYTLAKSMDDGSNQRDVVPNTYDTSTMWGPSEFDVRHTLVINYIYGLPFFSDASRLSGKLLGAWQISGVSQFQTGTPCGVAQSRDIAGVGLDSNFNCGINGQYWTVNGDPKIIGTFGTTGQWFATKNPDGTPIFTAPTPGTFNTQRVRNLIYQPGFQNWNLGLFKTIPVNERFRFQFRAEAYNVWNHPNWCGNSGCSGTTNIGLNPTNTQTFGKVLSKGSGTSGQGERNLQLSLRLEF